MLYALSVYLGLVGAFWLGTQSSILGTVVAVVAVYLASALIMLQYAGFYEKRSFSEIFDIQKSSWAFLFGDTIVLPITAMFVVLGWDSLVSVSWGTSAYEILGCFGIGLVAGCLFHAIDGANYKKQGAAEALSSPTKIAHDFCAYPVLFGGLLYGVIPLVQNWSWYTTIIALCVVVWLLLGVCDTKRGLDPKFLHPRWNKRLFSRLHW